MTRPDWLTDVVDGDVFVLIDNVRNPLADRRSREVFRQPVLPAGLRLRASVVQHEDGEEVTGLEYFSGCDDPQVYANCDMLLPSDDRRVVAMLPHLRRVSVSHRDWLRARRIDARGVLTLLMEAGRLTREEVMVLDREYVREG